MRLCVRDGRAVLTENGPEVQSRDLDPDTLALGVDLTDALREWARVADTVKSNVGSLPVDGVAGGLVSRRGRQLAGRLAAVTGAPVSYLDPLTGDTIEVTAPAAPSKAKPTRERTPWATGLTVTGFAAVSVALVVSNLSAALGANSTVLALVANVAIALGLAPSVWLARHVLVWRWVAYGVAVGLSAGWLVLLFVVL